MSGVISVEAGKLKCLICHSSTCSHCNYISSSDRLDPGAPVCIAEMFDNNRLSKVRVSTAVSNKRIPYKVNQEYQLMLTKDLLEYIESYQDLLKLIVRKATGSTCVC